MSNAIAWVFALSVAYASAVHAVAQTEGEQFGQFELVQMIEQTPDDPAAAIRVTGSVITDLDLDGRPELVIASGTFQGTDVRVGIYSADANGTFKWRAPWYTPDVEGASIGNIAAGDIDQDGDPDLVVSFFYSAVPPAAPERRALWILRNEISTGAGFVSEYVNGVPPSVNGVRVFNAEAKIVDLDQDGWPDYVAAPNNGPPRVAWGGPEGTYTLPQVLSGIDPSGFSFGFHFECADLDGDGLLDLIFGGKHLSYIHNALVRQVAPREFVAHNPFDFGVYGRATRFFLLDLDRDGDVDVAPFDRHWFPRLNVNNRDGNFDILFTGSGSIFVPISDTSLMPEYETGLLTYSGDADLADFDLDGNVDFLLAGVPSRFNPTCAVIYNNGLEVSGSWTSTTLVDDEVTFISGAHAVDVDGDRATDIVLVEGDWIEDDVSRRIVIYRNLTPYPCP
ncbi:MAG: VCBS repeat-containing protein, partial [Planctomycetota bacterium]